MTEQQITRGVTGVSMKNDEEERVDKGVNKGDM